MPAIDDVVQWVEGLSLEGGTTLVLRHDDPGRPGSTDAFFARLVQAPELRIAEAERARTPTGLQIKGRGSLHTYENLDPLVISFAGDEHGVGCTVEGSFSGALALPLITWVTVRRAGLAVALLPPADAVQLRFTADLAVSGSRPGVIPISISRVHDSVWQCGLAGQVSERVTVEDLVRLLSDNALAGFLPDALVHALEGLTITDLVATLDLQQKRVEDFSVGVKVTNGWPDIAPGFGLAPGLELILSLSDPTVPARRQTSGTVRGTLLIGAREAPTRVPVFAQMVASAQPTSWLLGLDPDPAKYDQKVGGVQLPTLADLLGLVSPGAASALPAGLRDMPAIVVSRLLVGFTTSPGTVQSLTFAANTASSWIVVEGVLAIESLAMELDVVRPDANAPLQIGGWLAGTFAVSATAWVALRVEKDPTSDDWTLMGGLAPGHTFNLTDIVATVLRPFVALPARAPALLFDEVSATAVPGKSLAFRAASHTPWPLLADLSVDAFTLEFTYTSGQPAGAFSGSLATAVTIARVSIEVRAALDASGGTGWQFEGRTAPGAPIQIGDLIADLGEKFGVHVPQPVNSLTLRNLRLGFLGGTGTDAAPTRFTFGCEGQFQIAGVALDATVAIDLTRAGTHYERHAEGTLAIHTASGARVGLKVTFSDSDRDTWIRVDWPSEPGPALTVTDIAAAFGFAHLPDLPDELKTLGLARLTFQYDFTKKELAVALTVSAGANQSLGQALFVRATLGKGADVYALGLTINTDIKLADLPLVGRMVPDGENLGIKSVSAWVLQGADQMPLDDLNALVKDAGLEPLAAGDVKSRVVLAGDLRLGAERAVHLSLPLGGAPPPAPRRLADRNAPALPLAAPATAATSDSPGMLWSDVGAQFGPFQLNRIGAGYQNGELRFGLDAGLSLGPIALAVDGLSVSSPLTAFRPRFDIAGLAVDIHRGGLEVSGGFQRVRDGEVDAYYGQVVVQVARFGLNAIGGYTPAHGETPAAFFLYARLTAPLGGPPFLFVTGLAAGFGVNSALILPTIDTLAGYPLLPRNAQPPQGSARETISTVVQDLKDKKVFADVPGQYWIALGLSFTSFEMIEAFALATVEFGVDLQIALIGSCAMSFPRETPVAYVEIDLVASCTPATGLLAVTGVLSPASFIYGGFVHLTGGFAFNIWFGGPHKGDFVVTLGGYYPTFNKPDFYPAVPRLGMQFALGPLHVTGEAYFALTPAMMMAGIAMQAIWDGGRIRAWLDVSLDILLAWAPFHYEARAYLSIGCSIDLGLLIINVHVSAEMQIWGPPFGGAVTVDLDIVAFTIAFGADRAEPAPVGWGTFRSSFLPGGRGAGGAAPRPPRLTARARQFRAAAAEDPGSRNIIQGSVEAGLLASNRLGVDWVVDPNHFSIVAISAVPATHAAWGRDPGAVPLLNEVARWRSPGPDGGDAPRLDLPHGTIPFSEHDGLVWNPTIGLKPMKRENVASYLTLRLSRTGEDDASFNAVTVGPVLEDVPAALYDSAQADKGANAPRTLPRALVGLRITPIPRHPAQVSDVRLGDLLFEEGYRTGFAEPAPASDARYRVSRTASATGLDVAISGAHQARLVSEGFVLGALADGWVASQRAAVLGDLVRAGFSTRPASDIDVGAFTTETALTDWPAVARLGERLAA